MDEKTVKALQCEKTLNGLLSRERVVAQLRATPHTIEKTSRNGNDDGWKLELNNGAIVNCFDTGTVNVQGTKQEDTAGYLGINTVFVIYGRDMTAKVQLVTMLKRWKLKPLLLKQLPWSGDTLIEKLETVRRDRNFAVVLATPVDEGYNKGKPNTKALRIKQKVIVQLGIMLTLLGLSKVVILAKGDDEIGIPSEIGKIQYIRYKDSVEEAGRKLAEKMKAEGLKIER